MKGLTGHGSLQALLGRTSYATPKRKRDDEQDFALDGGLPPTPTPRHAARHGSTSGVPPAASPRGVSKASKKTAQRQPAWDWTKNKPCPRPPANQQANATSTRPPMRASAPSPLPDAGSPALAKKPAGENREHPFMITCCVVGRRHRASSKETDSALEQARSHGEVPVHVTREPSNPVDSNALQVVLQSHFQPGGAAARDTSGVNKESSRLLGHVPSKLAQHLAPLMDSGTITVTGHVCMLPSRSQPLPDCVDADSNARAAEGADAGSGLAAVQAHNTGSDESVAPCEEGIATLASMDVSSPSASLQPAAAVVTSTSTPAAITAPPPALSRTAQPTTRLMLKLSCLLDPALSTDQVVAATQRLAAAQQAAADLAAGADAGGALRDKLVLMIDQLCAVDAHVFSAQERATMDLLRGLPPPQLSLLLRLFLRRGPWFALRDMTYQEVDSAEQCGAALVACGCMQAPAQGDCQALLQMLPAHKVLELAGSLGVVGVGVSMRRADLDAALLPACTCTRTATQRCLERSASLGLEARHSAPAGQAPKPGSTIRRRNSEPPPSLPRLGDHMARSQRRIASGLCQPSSTREEAAPMPNDCPSSPVRLVLSDDDQIGPLESPFKAASIRVCDQQVYRDSCKAELEASPAAHSIEVHAAVQDSTEALDAAATHTQTCFIDLTAEDSSQPAADAMYSKSTRLEPQHGLQTGSEQCEVNNPAILEIDMPVQQPVNSGYSCQNLDLGKYTVGTLGGGLMVTDHNSSGHVRQRVPCARAPTASQPPCTHRPQGPHAAASAMQRSDSSGVCKLQRHLLQLVGPCARVSVHVAQLIQRMQRVYFLNEAHDMARWVATERGALPYPPYMVCRARSAFPTRQVRHALGLAAQALLDYEVALSHAMRLDDCLTAGDVQGAERALAPAWQALSAGALRRVNWVEAPVSLVGTEEDTKGLQSDVIGTAGAGAEPGTNVGGLETTGVTVAGAEPSQEEAAGSENAVDAAKPVGTAGCAMEVEDEHGRAGGGGNGEDVGRPLPLFLARFCAAWVYAGMCTVGVSLHEKARRYGEAVRALRGLLDGHCCPGRRGEWWLRLSIDLEHQGDEEAALVAGESALKDTWVRHGDLLALQRRVLRLGKPPRRWKKPGWALRVASEPQEVVITGRPLGNATGVKSRFYSTEGRQVGVEALALEHYASAAGGQWQGLHCEGGVWASLAGLLLWDPLFAAVPDVFRTPCQTAPLDLDTDAFYPARRGMIDARLQEIASGGAERLLAQCWRAHRGQWCRGVNWDRYTLQQLQEIARCVGGLGLSVVCRMLVEDYNGWHGGMPDLLLWRPLRGDAKLSEVKGPRDRLSDAQRAWMAALSAVGMHCEVLRVQEPK